MSSPSALRKADFLRHLDSLYAFAQVLAPDADTAARLVEETYAIAWDDPSFEPSRPALLALLRTLRSNGLSAGTGPSFPPSLALLNARANLLNTLISRTLPPLFANMPIQQQALLWLCEEEQLDPAAAAAVLDMEVQEAFDVHEAARYSLRRALTGAATPEEQHLLAQGLPERWEAKALQQFFESTYSATPPTLRPTVAIEMTTPEDAAALTGPMPSPASTPHATPSRKQKPSLLQHIALALFLIFISGALGFFVSSLVPAAPATQENNLIALSAAKTEGLTPAFRTNSLEQAERFVFERLDWRLTLPAIDLASLTGVTMISLSEGVETPVFLWEDETSGQTVYLFTYNYALLEQHQDHFQLERDVLLQIEGDRHFDIHELSPYRVLIWRYRDDIFLAFTTSSAAALRDRIQFPS